MRLIKVGDIINDHKTNKPLYTIVDKKNKYYSLLTDEFFIKYKIIHSSGIVSVNEFEVDEEIIINNNITIYNNMGIYKFKMSNIEKINDIIDDIIIITKNSVFINIDKSFRRNLILNKII